MEKTVKHPVIAITMGDPGGVGPEVTVKALLKHRLSPKCRYLVIGSKAVFEELFRKTKLRFSFQSASLRGARQGDAAISFCKSEIASPEARNDKLLLGTLESGKVSFLDIGGAGFNIAKETAVNGRMAIKAIATAAELANRGLVHAIVTAPLNKASAKLEQKDFVGHTEFFAKNSGTGRYAMMFVGPKLKLTLATIHVPLKKVSELLTADLILEKILLTDETLKRDFGIQAPKIGVCALNPHGRECGEEEDRLIVPAVERAKKEGVQVSGPFPADTVFCAAYHGVYDAIISMYHDQALGPFKMIHFHDGVNVTLGLPYIRTSPDHGTAYDIAYQGKADPASMKAALKLAEKLALNRHA